MSLADVVLEIADEMEKVDWDYHHSCPNDGIKDVVSSFARQLRRAVKASENSDPITQGLDLLNLTKESPSPVLLKIGEAKRQELLQEQAIQATRQEFGTRMVEVIGPQGPDAVTDYREISPSMPEGAKTVFPEGVFVLTQGKLIYSKEESEKYKALKFQQS